MPEHIADLPLDACTEPSAASDRLRVLQVAPFFAPAWCYGGLVESAYQFSRHLSRAGASVRVLTTNANGPRQRLGRAATEKYAHAERFEVRYCARVARQSVSPELLGMLLEHVRWADVVHLHAAYSFPTIPTLLHARVLNRPVVWTPHGAFQRWSGSRRVKLKRLWERLCAVAAPDRLALHLTSEAEANDARTCFPRARIEVVPNGVEIPGEIHRASRGTQLRLGFIGRLDPKKGIDNLLAACRILKDRGKPDFSLAIAGAGSIDYEAKLRDAIDRLGLSAEVHLLGDVRGQDKLRMLETTDVVVVPSFTENFAIVVAEALAHGAAVIASTGTPWSALDGKGCGLWVSNRPASLAEAIASIYPMPVAAMGLRGRSWMAESFSWEQCAAEILALYNSLRATTNGAVLEAARQ